ncbi:MAG: hypothetical protein ACJ74U_03060 [Jatrophihabitantaceae bacterium]
MSLTDVRPQLRRLAAAVPDRRPLVVLVLAQLLTGVVLGLIWLAWSPTSVSYMLDSGHGSAVVVPGESESQVAGDGRYALLTVLAGLVFGLLAWRLRSNRGSVTLLVLGASSLLSSLLALATGQLLSNGHDSAPVNTAFHPPLALHATAAVFLQALLAVLVYTVFVGLAGDQHLGRGRPADERTDQPDEQTDQAVEWADQPDERIDQPAEPPPAGQP